VWRAVAIVVAGATLSAATACSTNPPAASSAPTRTGNATSPAGQPPASADQAATPAGSAAPVTGVYAPRIDPAEFGAAVDNPYFPLRPGMRWEYRAKTADGLETTVVQATARTRTLMGVTCVEVRDTVRLDGEVVEDTYDWYAQQRDGTVWYFGEDTKEYEGGKVISTEGSWQAGVDGALPGIVMPAYPTVGDRYRQEYYRGHAEDMAEVLDLAGRARVPAGSYDGVVVTKDHTPLEPKLLENKYYARGVGPVLTVDVAAGGGRDELVRFTG
jgi:hypothetical protein